MDFIVKENRIQEAIDAANAAGGGRVVLGPGIYHCGTIYLKNFVELHLTAGARLQGSSKAEDYDDFKDPAIESFDGYMPEKSWKCLLVAAHAENIAITGTGEINGAGPAFYDTNNTDGRFFRKPSIPRPRILEFVECRNVRIEGVSFVDSPGWSFWLVGCEEVNISRIRLTGCQKMINNDGIHLDSCRRVMISDSFIKTGDDSIVIRAIRKFPDKPVICEDVTVCNCVLDSACQCIRIGCPSDDTARNCTFSNLTLKGHNGIRVNNPLRYARKGLEGVYMDNILFNNLSIDVENIPIGIDVEEGVVLRKLGGLTFSNIRLRGGQPCMFEGSESTYIDDIRFSEIVCDKMPVAHHCRRVTFNQIEINCE